MDLVKKFFVEEEGQDLVEYGLLVAFIALLVVLAVMFFSGTISNFFNRVSANIELWPSGPET